MENKRKSLWLYLAALLIPCAVVLLCFVLLGIAPFGDDTILLQDAAIQYLDFAAYLRTVFTGENDLLYTLGKNLGGELVSLFTYYLCSPFSLLFALGTLETLPLTFTAVAVLKMGTSGLTFFYAASKRFGCKWQNLIFSTAYALMAYNTLYCWNIMWMDGVLILPLLALGLENLWQGKSCKLYVFSLAYGLLTNFYIGYMLCIGSVLFCLALALVSDLPGRDMVRRFGKFVFASCVGGFASAFAWLPTFFSLLGGRASGTTGTFVWTRTFNVLGLAGKLVAGSANEQQLSLGTPHVFCGIFTVLLVVVFFLNRKNGVKRRLVPLGLLAVLLVSFCIRGLDMVWHGFSPNNSYNFRYAFLFSYVLLVIAQHTWEQRSQIPKSCFIAAGALLLVMAAGLVVMKYKMGLAFLSLPGIAISAGVVLLATLYFLSGDGRRYACFLFALACVFEMGANYYISMASVLQESGHLSLLGYQKFVQQTKPAVDAVKTMDSGLYRLEKTFMRNKNDSMLLGYNGLTHFSSSQDKAIPRYMAKLGMTNYEGIWSQYDAGTTMALDSFFGVKYLLSESDQTAAKGYILRNTVNGIGIYGNPNALPIAMVAQEDILQVDSDTENCFVLQNRLWQGITGTETDYLLQTEEYQLVLDNLTQTEPGSGVYTKINPGEAAMLTYELTITSELPLYAYFSAPEVQSVRMQINGVDAGSYFGQYRWNTVSVGAFAPGDRIAVSLVPNGDTLCVENPWFYYEDVAAVAAAAQAVKENPITLQRNTSSNLSGSFTAQQGQLLLFTIPCDSGWKLILDGEEVSYTRAADLFLAVPVDEGSHSFEMQFIPPGAQAGMILSVGAVVVAAAWLLLQRKRKTV